MLSHRKICHTAALGKEPPCHRTRFQIRLQKWAQPQTLESGICLTATVSSERLRLKKSKAGNMLNPTLKPYHFLWAGITHLFAQHPTYFSSYGEVPEVLSLLPNSETKQGNVTRVTRLCRRAEGKVAFSFQLALAWFSELNSREWLEDIFKYSIIQKQSSKCSPRCPEI